MLNNNNLIVVYGKARSYKSSLAATLVNGLNDIACYINLEENKHIELNTKVKVFDDINIINREFIEECVSDYNVVLIDSLDKLDLKKDDLLYLKELAKKNNTLIIVTINSDDCEEFKGFADLIIYSKKGC